VRGSSVEEVVPFDTALTSALGAAAQHHRRSACVRAHVLGACDMSWRMYDCACVSVACIAFPWRPRRIERMCASSNHVSVSNLFLRSCTTQRRTDQTEKAERAPCERTHRCAHKPRGCSKPHWQPQIRAQTTCAILRPRNPADLAEQIRHTCGTRRPYSDHMHPASGAVKKHVPTLQSRAH
jgi:hypothetical protein